MTRALAALFLAVLAAAPPAGAQARTVRIPSPAYDGAERIFSVLLPAGYADAGAAAKRYPVLYLLHGGGQDHSAFMARSAFVRTARRNEMIVVMPAADRTLGGRPGVQARYETFLATELIPYVDANYRTVPSPAGRAIGGISQGGGYAASTALRYPGVYGWVGAFSPAFRGATGAEGTGGPPSEFYVSCGTADSLLPASRQLVRLLEDQKIPHEYRELPGRGHTWDVWDEELAVFVDRLGARPGWRETAPQ